MRDSFIGGLRRPTPVVQALLGLMLVSFVAVAIAARTSFGDTVIKALWFDPQAVLRGQLLWTFLTSWLVHDLTNPSHLVFNGLGLYFFGPDLEDRWGPRRFLVLAALSQVTGCLFVLGSSIMVLSIFGLAPSPVVGASSIVMGVMIAWGLAYRDRQFIFLFFPMRGIHLVYITLGFAILDAISLSPVSAPAHFGGMAAGALFFLHQSGRLRPMWTRLWPRGASSGGPGRSRRPGGPSLRVILGERDKPPPDKRYLN
jgi:membrane associated rhomboid family serine protease